jgi:hypothetical protein
MWSQWWVLASIAVSALILISTIANRLKYEQIRKAYIHYMDEEARGMGGDFMDYVFMDPATIELNSTDEEIIYLKRKELKFRFIAMLSYASTILICGSVMLLVFYEILPAPPWIGFLFLFFILLSAYSMHRSWRRGLNE